MTPIILCSIPLFHLEKGISGEGNIGTKCDLLFSAGILGADD